MKQSDSREKLFDSSLKTVNVSVNTELSMNSSSNSKKEVNDYFHFYGDGDDDVFHKMISVDNLAYSTSYNDEDCDNGERHTDTGLETCDALKPTRHGNETLGKSIQSAGIGNITYLPGDDTGGTGHTQVYESGENMLVSHSISENQSESDMDLKDDILSDDEIYSDTDDGKYFSTDESLEGILDFGSFKSTPCTVVSFQEKHSLTDLDPRAVLRSSEVPDPSDKWEDVDLASFCVFDEFFDQDVMFSSPIGFVGSFIDIVDYVEDILRRHSSLELLLFAKSADCDDAASFCSILTDKLQYCQSDTSDSVRHFSYDSFKAMNAKQRFFDAAFNNEHCIGSICGNSCKAINVTKHQLFDAPNSNILNKNVLNIAEATAVSNIPSKISRGMFFPTIFLQYVKDKYENNNSYRNDPITNIYGISTTPGTENIEYVMVRGLIIRKDYKFLLCNYFHQHISLSEKSESVRIKPGYLMMVIIYQTTTLRYYFPGMVDLVEEFVECYLEGQRVEREIDGSETIARIVRMDITMSVSEVSFRSSDHTRSMIRLTISYSQE